jgi:hypothetical protein
VASVDDTEAVRSLWGHGRYAVSASPAPDLQLDLVLRSLRVQHVRGARDHHLTVGTPLEGLSRSLLNAGERRLG